MADQLATVEDLSALLRQEVDPDVGALLIECATAIVQDAAGGQRIVQVVDDLQTIYLDGYDNSTWLTLPQRPVTDVSVVSLAGTTLTDWHPHLTTGRLFRTCGWRSAALADPLAPTSVDITYTHGYAPGDQRLQLARAAVLQLAAHSFTNPSGAIREQIDDYSVQFSEMAAEMAASSNLARSLRRRYGVTSTSVRLVHHR